MTRCGNQAYATHVRIHRWSYYAGEGFTMKKTIYNENPAVNMLCLFSVAFIFLISFFVT